ncbi:MAG: hypothetical protein V3U54_06050, partial [Thermodesulfobacteriota bacterium]
MLINTWIKNLSVSALVLFVCLVTISGCGSNDNNGEPPLGGAPLGHTITVINKCSKFDQIWVGVSNAPGFPGVQSVM